MKKYYLLFLLSAMIQDPVWALDFRGSLGVEARYFMYDNEVQPSLFVEPEWYWQNEQSNSSITFKPFARWDETDQERSHQDIRELFFQYASDQFELLVGINKIYWGVTESQHLVDVINQTDYLEGFDGEDKLGQPMIQFTSIRDWGVMDFFVLPYFREREYAGDDGHFNFEQKLGAQLFHAQVNDAVYESKDEKQHLDAAFRYSHSLGNWDFGLSYFDGTQRNPYLNFSNPNPSTEEISLTPYYAQMQQFGVDLQATLGAWLWKAEIISRSVMDDQYIATTAGFEYTFYGVNESGADLGLLFELNQSDDEQLAQSAAQNDLFIGGRYTWNDEQSSEILFGISQDLENASSYAAKIEASRRIGDNYKFTVDSWFFNSDSITDPLFGIKNEDFVQLAVEYYF